jgi:hypothetical protein
MFLMLYVMHIYLVTLRSAPFAQIESRFLDMLSLHKELKLIMQRWKICLIAYPKKPLTGAKVFRPCGVLLPFCEGFQHHCCIAEWAYKEGSAFLWSTRQENAFDMLKDKLTHAPLLQLPDFNKTFELECDTSGIGLGGVLLQERKPVT